MPEVRFRKRPVVITAIQWTGENVAEVREFTGPSNFSAKLTGDRYDREITAEVWDGLHLTWVGVKSGQWIIRGVAGEFYPIDEAVLAETYERLEPTDGAE